MSRRVQIHLVKTEDGNVPGWFRHELELVVYGPAGKAAIRHDHEMLMMAIADTISGGTHTAQCSWVLNDRKPELKPSTAMDILHGWEKNYRWARHRPDVDATREVIFDAGEQVWRGSAVWKVAKPRSDNGEPGGGDIYTPAEMFRAAVTAIMRPLPPAIYPPDGIHAQVFGRANRTAATAPAHDPDFEVVDDAEPALAPARWVYRHEGD